MTDDNRRQNAIDELRRAEEALRASEALLDLALAGDAASRIYYAAYHATRALLFSRGLEATSHRATRTLLAQHFVRTGLVDGAYARDLAELEGLRSAGDYDQTFCVPIDALRDDLARARRAVAQATALLCAEGLLS